MTKSEFIELKEDGACLPCERPKIENMPTDQGTNPLKQAFLAGCYYKEKYPEVAEEYLWDSFKKEAV